MTKESEFSLDNINGLSIGVPADAMLTEIETALAYEEPEAYQYLPDYKDTHRTSQSMMRGTGADADFKFAYVDKEKLKKPGNIFTKLLSHLDFIPSAEREIRVGYDENGTEGSDIVRYSYRLNMIEYKWRDESLVFIKGGYQQTIRKSQKWEWQPPISLTLQETAGVVKKIVSGIQEMHESLKSKHDQA